MLMRTGGAGLLIPGISIVQAGADSLTFLLRDDFTTAASAPLTSPRTAEPGPGTLTISDTDISISGGAMVIPGETNDIGAYGAALSRAAGLALFAEFSSPSLGNSSFGWSANTGLGSGSATNQIGVGANGFLRESGSDYTSVQFGAMANSTSHLLGVILRSAGAFTVRRVSGVWTLHWVSNTNNTASVRPVVVNYSSTNIAYAYMRALQLAAPFDTDYGLATQRTASPSADATITSEANAVIEFTWVAVTGETVEVSTRRTTDNDRWILRGDQAGSTVKLIEVVAGVETERATAAQTWTNTTSYRIVVVQDGNTIRGYVANVLKWTYASAASNNTATGIKTNKAGTNLIAWPRTLTGTAAALLDSAVA